MTVERITPTSGASAPVVEDLKVNNCLSFSLEEPLEYLSELKQTFQEGQGKIPMADDMFSKLEDIVIFYVQIRNAPNKTAFCAALLSYIKTHFDHSLVKTVYDAVNQTIGMDTQGEGDPCWLEDLRKMKDNWSKLVTNNIFGKVSSLLSIAVAVGLCSERSLNLDFNGIQLFSTKNLPIHKNATSLIDACIKTFHYFMEGGYMCFKKGSITPLLTGDFAKSDLEDRYFEACEMFTYARTGNIKLYSKGDWDAAKYDKFLNDIFTDLKRAREACVKNSVASTLLHRQLHEISRMRAIFNQKRVDGGKREEPYSFLLFGESGVGKSSLTHLMLVTILKAAGYACTADHLCTLRPGDKHWNSYTGSINGVLIDDIHNARPEFISQSPTEMVRELVNNVKVYAPKAELEEKGTVPVDPRLVVATSNIKDMGAPVYSNEPYSISRRMQVVITVEVKEPYRKEDSFELSSEKAKFAPGGVYKDCWYFKVEKVVPIKRGGKTTTGYKVLEHKGKKLDRCTVHDLVPFLIECANKHYAYQRKLVEEDEKLHDAIQIHDKCGLPVQMCTCPKDPPPSDKIIIPRQWKGTCIDIPEPPLVTCKEICTQTSPIHIKPSIDDSGGTTPLTNQCEDLPTLETNPDRDDYISDEIPKLCEKDVELCGCCGIPIELDSCKCNEEMQQHNDPNLDIQSADYIVNEFKRHFVPVLQSEWDRLLYFSYGYFFSWTRYISTRFLQYRYIQAILFDDTVRLSRIEKASSWSLFWIFHIYILYLWTSQRYTYSILLCFLHVLFLIANYINYLKEKLILRMIHQKNQRRMVNDMRVQHRRYLVGTSMLISVLFMFITAHKIRNWFKKTVVEEQGEKDMSPPEPEVQDTQGNIISPDKQDVADRDEEQNTWAKPDMEEIPQSEKSATTTWEDLSQRLFRNLANVAFERPATETEPLMVSYSNVLFLCSNVFIMPLHMWRDTKAMRAKFTLSTKDKVSATFVCHISNDQMVPIPDKDLCLVYCANVGSWKDLSGHLPKTEPGKALCHMIYKRKDGTQYEDDMPVTRSYFNSNDRYLGFKYQTTEQTFKGLCMATLISKTTHPLIHSFHVAGLSKTGASASLLYSEFIEARELLRESRGVLLCVQEGTMPTSLYGVDYYLSESLHTKSPVNYLPEGTRLRSFGSVTGRATYHSEVVPTLIADTVTEVWGIENTFGPPKLGGYAPWRNCLLHAGNPAEGIPVPLVNAAIDDYCSQVIPAYYKSLGEGKDDSAVFLKPLSEVETVSGIDGLRFIDSINQSTSIGFPLSGPKTKYLTDLEPTDEHACPREIDRKFWDEAYRMRDEYLADKRAYPIFKGSLKDEPTPIDKDKVRVFCAAPMAFQLLVRKYYLPILRLMATTPVASECAVGIDAAGPEWDQLKSYVEKFGADRIIAGDYSKYDLRMPAQIMLAAFTIMHEIAYYFGYSEEDIKVMEGIATDVTFSINAFNGDLIGFFGVVPSGVNLTVFLNSLCNIILLRAGFFNSVCPGLATGTYTGIIPRFYDSCAFTTYGDDFEGSCKDDRFNFLIFQEFLARFGFVITMPDKKSDPVPYMLADDVDFLKRKNSRLKELDCNVGKLDENSILKSMFARTKSKYISPDEHAASVLDDALREFFLHGREIYEDRREKIIEIAKKHKLFNSVLTIGLDYDQRVERWYDRYRK